MRIIRDARRLQIPFASVKVYPAVCLNFVVLYKANNFSFKDCYEDDVPKPLLPKQFSL